MHPESESKVISLEERAKVTEALEAILDDGGSRLSATDFMRLKAGGVPVLRSRINPSSPRNFALSIQFFTSGGVTPIGRDQRLSASVGTEVMTALK